MTGISEDLSTNFETNDCLVCQRQDTGELSVVWSHIGFTNLTQREVDKILNHFCKDSRDKGILIIWRGCEPTEEQRQMRLKFYYEVEKIKGHRTRGEYREFGCSSV